MSVRIRMKRMGRTHRPFFRICAMDRRTPRDGRVLEELGTYDPSVPDTDARAILKSDRIDHWLGVGATPSDNVAVLIRKYGTDGTHLEAQAKALAQLAEPKVVPDPGKPASLPKPPAPPEPAAESTAESAATEAAETDATETPGAETAAADSAPPESPPTEEAASTDEAAESATDTATPAEDAGGDATEENSETKTP